MFLLLFFLFFTTLLFWNFVWKRKGLPPGPTPLPIFGNAFSINNSIYEQFQIWAKEYGPVYTIWLGEEPTVIVTDYEIMRDLFIKEGDIYAGRNFLVDLFKTFSGCGISNRTLVFSHNFIKTQSNKIEIQSNDRELNKEQ
uniref:Uncharacterized protein n=1 Tax=Meloidogyne incognita TaxID=6306 RepID=A0A914MIN4_MELIC